MFMSILKFLIKLRNNKILFDLNIILISQGIYDKFKMLGISKAKFY